MAPNPYLPWVILTRSRDRATVESISARTRALPHHVAIAEDDLYQVFQRHLPGFERMWADSDSESCLPGHVTQELPRFLTCGILSHGFHRCTATLVTNGISWLSVAKDGGSAPVVWDGACTRVRRTWWTMSCLSMFQSGNGS